MSEANISDRMDQVNCPKCGESIRLAETLRVQMIESVRSELKREKSKLEQEALNKAREELSVQIRELTDRIEEKEQSLKTAQEAELVLRRERRNLEERARSFDLEVTRKLDEERNRIRDEAVRAVLAEHSLRDAEKDKKLQDAINANEELRRKLHQGSQQTQGEVLELALEELLRSRFPQDEIAPVSKGIRGADLLQKVFSPVGQVCGTIIWESKRTRSWSDGWLSKLKDDQREVKADAAILVTEALPKDISLFGNRNGIWITRYGAVTGLATVIRTYLIQVAAATRSAEGKNEKMEVLYRYLSGTEFRQKIEAIVESFAAMQQDLSEEKRAYLKRWAKREKQIERVIHNTVGMYGSLQGLMGSSIEPIPALESEGSTKQDSSLPSDDEFDEDLFNA